MMSCKNQLACEWERRMCDEKESVSLCLCYDGDGIIDGLWYQ